MIIAGQRVWHDHSGSFAAVVQVYGPNREADIRTDHGDVIARVPVADLEPVARAVATITVEYDVVPSHYNDSSGERLVDRVRVSDLPDETDNTPDGDWVLTIGIAETVELVKLVIDYGHEGIEQWDASE